MISLSSSHNFRLYVTLTSLDHRWHGRFDVPLHRSRHLVVIVTLSSSPNCCRHDFADTSLSLVVSSLSASRDCRRHVIVIFVSLSSSGIRCHCFVIVVTPSLSSPRQCRRHAVVVVASSMSSSRHRCRRLVNVVVTPPLSSPRQCRLHDFVVIVSLSRHDLSLVVWQLLSSHQHCRRLTVNIIMSSLSSYRLRHSNVLVVAH